MSFPSFVFALLAALALAPDPTGPGEPDFDLSLDVVRKGYDGKTCWVHPRAGVIPRERPRVVMTLHRLDVRGSDLFFPVAHARTDDLGGTWSDPVEHASEFGRRVEPNRVECGVCDFTPRWHARSGKLLAVGQTVRYRDDKVIPDRPRETAYTVYDPAADGWTAWRTVDMPDEPRFYSSGAGSAQRVDLADGTILLPIYFRKRGAPDYSVTVMRCEFDGQTLTPKEFGNVLTVPGGRGLYEPSLTRYRGRYYLTLRNDKAGYVASGTDGLRFDGLEKWRWDDGTELGSYNTQQHWVTHSDGLFLVYTRKGAGNDHVFRHRAPLFIARVDPETRRVVRTSERVLVPERGARLGNFGVTDVSPDETWVTVAEWMQGPPPQRILPADNEHGADNSVYVARIRWKTPNRLAAE